MFGVRPVKSESYLIDFWDTFLIDNHKDPSASQRFGDWPAVFIGRKNRNV